MIFLEIPWGFFVMRTLFHQNGLKKSHGFVSIYKPRPDPLIFYRGGGYDKVRKASRQQNRKISKPVERLRRKATRACNMAASRTLFSPGKVTQNLAPPCEDASASLQESERAAGLQGFRALYQPFGRCGALLFWLK